MSESKQPSAVVVDDNLMFSMMVEPQLKRLGYAARTLSGGPSTEDEIAALRPEVVFVNLTSTRYDGADLLHRLRARPELAGTGLVGYAGHVEREYFQSGEAGADMVVPNSAMRASLPEVLEKLRRRMGGEQATDDTDRADGHGSGKFGQDERD